MVEQSEIAQMSKFMAALSNSSADNPHVAVSDPSVNAMKTILEKFHAVAGDLITDQTNDKELREALLTESIKDGVRVGIWEIHSHYSGKRRLYDVVRADGDVLARDLMLYEAARRLVRILNEGGHINCREAVELLRTEQDYASAVHDMVLFRHQLTKYPKSPRAPIFEARYSDAKQRALHYRSHLGG